MLKFDSNTIRDRAKEKGVSQEDIAGACYVEKKTVFRWFHKKAPYPAEALPAIAELLGCTIMDFYNERSEEDERRG